VDSLSAQVALVSKFAEDNFLKLNIQKCELVVFDGGHKHMLPVCEVEGSLLPSGYEGKCLGFWWRRDLMASRAVEEGIRRARRSFFHFGSIGSFQGDLSPLSTRSVVETCVIPRLLYGCENWNVTEGILAQLESFLGEVAKRALRWPKHYSNTSAVTAMDLGSVRSRLLVSKLGFLKRLLRDDAVGVGRAAIRSMVDDVDSLCLVRECRELEDVFRTNFTEEVLCGEVNMKEVKKTIERLDRERRFERCGGKAPLIAAVAKGVSWLKLWDLALELGLRHTRGLQALSRLMSHHDRGKKPCPLCEGELNGLTVLEHVLEKHKGKLPFHLTIQDVLAKLTEGDLQFVYCFWNFYPF
jgi:hypothetical protein